MSCAALQKKRNDLSGKSLLDQTAIFQLHVIDWSSWLMTWAYVKTTKIAGNLLFQIIRY